ncbi:hypothetical protein G9P44_006167 [Scheffersomyces stipitis]|nr:hypothetical protein G9P44_006167 [Scheffersomyces stipitis]
MKSSIVLLAGVAATLAADITEAPTTSTDNPYTQYPSVPKTASINGFADRIYDDLPACAQPCMFQNTGITPCPYWDTGCSCVMPSIYCYRQQAIPTDDASPTEESSTVEETPTADETSSTEETEETSTEETSTDEETSSTEETTDVTETLPTASINGFVDPIYDKLPACAQPCVFQDTGITPCPYRDAGCSMRNALNLSSLIVNVLQKLVVVKTLPLQRVWSCPSVPALVLNPNHTGELLVCF